MTAEHEETIPGFGTVTLAEEPYQMRWPMPTKSSPDTHSVPCFDLNATFHGATVREGRQMLSKEECVIVTDKSVTLSVRVPHPEPEKKIEEVMTDTEVDNLALSPAFIELAKYLAGRLRCSLVCIYHSPVGERTKVRLECRMASILLSYNSLLAAFHEHLVE